ncbi:MAG: AAA domain-containing protein [Patescibacteria group bacterium]
MKKIIIHGPANNVFARTLSEKTQDSKEGIDLEIIEDFIELKKRLSDLKKGTVVCINKSESEILKIKKQYPKLAFIMCHGNEKSSQPFITWIDSEKNHQDFWYDNPSDFFEKIKNPPLESKLLFSALPEDDLYQVNFCNLPDLVKKKNEKLDPKLFWFSIFFSRVYLSWYKRWLKEVSKKVFKLNVKPSGTGNTKKLELIFNNEHQGELIFREDGVIEFGELYCETCYPLKPQVFGRVTSSDSEGIKVAFSPPVFNGTFGEIDCFCRRIDILSLTVATYAKKMKEYSDFSLDGSPLPVDQFYHPLVDDYYYSPEAYLRGYVPNNNQRAVNIDVVDLSGRAKQILRDKSQSEALVDILDSSYLSVVEGIPGGGKTFLVGVAVKQFIFHNKIVIVTSHSNDGLDNLLKTLTEHVDEGQIFRLGNNCDSTSSKLQKLHRRKRYMKIVESERKAYEKKQRSLNDFSEPFNLKEREIFHESESIWELVCSGKGVVLAATENSFEFDKTLKRLFNQNDLIKSHDFAEKKYYDPGIPKSVYQFMAKDPLRPKPSTVFSIGIVDEATKGLPYEIFPIVRRIRDKLILIGNKRQLGNIEIQGELKSEVIRYTMDRVHLDSTVKSKTLFPNLKSESGRLMPTITNESEIEEQFKYFSEGIFFYLSKFVKQLDINRRSLPEIVKFLNHVFKENIKIGRFNPKTDGKVVFLDVKGSKEKRVKTSYRNLAESIVVAREMINFFKKQKKESGEINLNSLGVIAMYRSQVLAIKERVRKDLLFNPIFSKIVNSENIDVILNKLVNTVDAFQGSERDLIIVSLVRSNNDGQTGFSSNLRRFYVALTRARNELIVIGNSQTFLKDDKNGIFKRILFYTKSNNTYSIKKVQ